MSEYKNDMQKIFNKLMEAEEIGNQTAQNVSKSLQIISETAKDRNRQIASSFEGLSPNNAKMATDELNNQFTVDINNLLNFLRSGMTKRDAYKHLETLNDGWRKFPQMSSAMFNYAMNDNILSAARSGATYDGGYNDSTGELVFNYPKNYKERLEQI